MPSPGCSATCPATPPRCRARPRSASSSTGSPAPRNLAGQLQPERRDAGELRPAPNFTGVTAWLNTPGGKPLSLRALRGKVVLVDFWTYSCINCQRTLPHVEAWYREYAKDGFVVVGVHAPEFAFEHVVSNVRAQAAALGVRYPVAIDDNYATWNAYDNEYWPADYLIDAQGDVRHVHFGEGDYAGTEQLIRQLLAAAHPGVRSPPTDVPDKTPAGELSPETYVGYERLQYLVPGNDVIRDAPAAYRFPASLPLGRHGAVGDLDRSRAGGDRGSRGRAGTRLPGPEGVPGAGRHRDPRGVRGRPARPDHRGRWRAPALHPVPGGLGHYGKLLLRASPGVQAYDFTFG